MRNISVHYMKYKVGKLLLSSKSVYLSSKTYYTKKEFNCKNTAINYFIGICE